MPAKSCRGESFVISYLIILNGTFAAIVIFFASSRAGFFVPGIFNEQSSRKKMASVDYEKEAPLRLWRASKIVHFGRCYYFDSRTKVRLQLCSCCGNFDPICSECVSAPPSKWKPYDVCHICDDFLTKKPCKLSPDECVDAKKGFPCIQLDHRKRAASRAATFCDDDEFILDSNGRVVMTKKAKAEEKD